MSAIKCDCCGKFREPKNCVAQEEDSSDGYGKEYIECRWCMSEIDLIRYGFKLSEKKGE